MKGIITRSRYRKGTLFCEITDGRDKYFFQTGESVSKGSAVVVQGEIRGKDILSPTIVFLSGSEASDIYKQVEERSRNALEVPNAPALVEDEITKSLFPYLKMAAEELNTAKIISKDVILRFHGDADGISGAFAISNTIRCRAYQQNSAVYSVRDALRDIGSADQEAKTLIILLDFGSNDDSSEAIQLLEAAGIDVLVIDHHPLGKNPPKILVNPYLVSQDASKYTAGYLACEIAVMCGMDSKSARELAKTACAGDKSNILQTAEEDKRKAMVLDFLAAHTSFGNNIDFYKKVMKKQELLSSIAVQAEDAIGEAAERAKKLMKKQMESQVEIVSFPLSTIAKKGEWPPSGKITTKIFESLSKETPLVCIGYNERSLILRMNDSAVGLGLSANALARTLLASMPDFVEGGGGHGRAGAIRARKDFVKEVLSELVRQIGKTAAETGCRTPQNN